MMKSLAGVLLAAVLLFIWGFLYWGISTVPYTAWAHTADDRAAQQALHQHFPTSGTYYVPSPRLPAAQLQALRAGGGPNSMLHVQYNAPSRGDPIELAAIWM